MSKFKIISIDGGGIKGTLAISLLERLSKEFGFTPAADLYSGTSTGGIIALALAQGRLTLADIGDLYLRRGSEIFSKNWLAPLTLSGSKYHNRGLQKVLTDVYGPATVLGELPKRVLIPSFKLCDDSGWSPRFFDNFNPKSPDAFERVVDVAMATSAAPTFFPSHRGYVDGGMAANNPSMCAVALALKHGVPLTDITVLSVGTGDFRPCIDGDVNWGYAGWGKKIVPLFFGGLDRIPDYQVKQLLGERYLRINPELDDDHGMDNADWAPELYRLGQTVPLGDGVGKWIAEHWA